ncbi:MAG: GntR family transcriptional regulator [Rhodospirillales bacterium]
MPERRGTVKETRAEALRRALADAILDGAIAPGAHLDEQEIATPHGGSRTPLREAQRQLAAIGLVDLRPRRGALAVAVSPVRIAEMHDVLNELETLAARLAAERMTPIQRRRLAALHQSMAEPMRAGDHETYEAGNVAFHAAIFEGSHNGFLAETARGVRERLRPFSRGRFRLLGRLQRSFAEHATIVDAIARGDADGAAAAMARHVTRVGDAPADRVTGPRQAAAVAAR